MSFGSSYLWDLVVLVEQKRVSVREEMHVWIERSKRELSLLEIPFTWATWQELQSLYWVIAIRRADYS